MGCLEQLSKIGVEPLKIVYQLIYQWIGLRENLQENPIFNGKILGFRLIFP